MKFLVMLQVVVRMVVLVQSWSDDASGIIVLLSPAGVEVLLLLLQVLMLLFC